MGLLVKEENLPKNQCGEMCSMERQIICRCEEVTNEEILHAIEAGDSSIDSIKKRTRACMGYCQGRTCKRLIAKFLADYYDTSIENFLSSSARVPIEPICLDLIGETLNGSEE